MRIVPFMLSLCALGCSATSPRAVVAIERSLAVQAAAPAESKAPAEPKSEAWHGHIPIGYANTGIALGNAKDWNGLRLNWQDEDLGTINGLNVTIWKHASGDATGSVNGVGVGLLTNVAAKLRGAFVALFANAAEDSMSGVHLAGFVNGAKKSVRGIGGALAMNGAGDSMCGIHFAGLMNGCGGDLGGVNAALLMNGCGGNHRGIGAALLMNGCGGDQCGIQLGGLMNGSGGSSTGVALGGLMAGSGQDATGITAAGLFAGCGRDLTGVNLALISAGGGRSVRGITLGGLFINSGGHTKELDEALEQMQADIREGISRGEQMGAGEVRERIEKAHEQGEGGEGAPGSISGIALTGVRARAGSMTGIVAALGHLSAEEFTGLGISLCTRIEKAQTGMTFGAFNHAETIDGFGFQLGLLNHIPTNPKWARWLPLLNWQM